MQGRLRELWITLRLGLDVTLLFHAFPAIDLWTTRLFYRAAAERGDRFPFGDWGVLRAVRELGLLVPRLVVVGVLAALVVKLVRPARPMPVPPRAALFLLMSLLLGPGLVTNVILKDNWGRPRPQDVAEFGGSKAYVKPWVISDQCPRNCSFVSGEASAAFWTVALSALAPPQHRAAALGLAIGYGALIGGLRIAFGGHFLSDVLLAGVLTTLVVWGCYRWLYVVQPRRLQDESLERALERFAAFLYRCRLRLFHALTQVARRLRGPRASTPNRHASPAE